MPNHSAPCRRDGCKKTADGGKGYCVRHYRAWKRGELPKARFQTCRVEACRKRVAARGRCEEHLARDYAGKQQAAAPAEA